MPKTNNAVEPDGSTYPDTDEIRERLQGLLSDLDMLDDSLAAIHVRRHWIALERLRKTGLPPNVAFPA